MYVYVYIYIYNIYIYIYTYIHNTCVYIYIHIYNIHTSSLLPSWRVLQTMSDTTCLPHASNTCLNHMLLLSSDISFGFVPASASCSNSERAHCYDAVSVLHSNGSRKSLCRGQPKTHPHTEWCAHARSLFLDFLWENCYKRWNL